MKNIQRIIEIPLEEVRSNNYEKNLKLYGENINTCFLCGKPTTSNKHVHYMTNGNIVSYQGEDIEGSQGMFPVGSDCAKGLVIQFAF